MGSAYQFHSWRVFVLVCAFPSVAAICALTTMPESPRFFLEVSNFSRIFIFKISVGLFTSRGRQMSCQVANVKIRWRSQMFEAVKLTGTVISQCYIMILLINANQPSVCFFSQNGKHDEAWMILKQVHDTNMRAKGYPERVFSVSHPLLHLFPNPGVIQIQTRVNDCKTSYYLFKICPTCGNHHIKTHSL